MIIYFFDIFARLLPEVCTMSFIVYTLSHAYINRSIYIAMNLFLCLSIYIIKTLPLFPVINIMMNVILFISVFVIMKIPLIKSIKNTFSAFTILVLCEVINIILCFCFKIDISEETSTCMKDIYGIPSIVLFIVIALLVKNREKNKNCSLKDGNLSEDIYT